MSQFSIYIDEQFSKRLEKAIRASGKPWRVVEVIKRSLDNQWTEGCFDPAGS